MQRWEPVFGDINDLACWDGSFFLHIWQDEGSWSWLVTNFNGKIYFGQADNMDMAKTEAVRALSGLKAELNVRMASSRI